METSIQNFIEMCQWDPSVFMIFSGNVFGKLIYYSHFLALSLSLIVGMFLLYRGNKILVNRILALIMFTFSIWVFFDLILWANEKPKFIMFFWSTMLVVEPLIYALSVYFIDVFINKKDITFKKKVAIFSLIAPILFFLPTKLSLVGFDLTNCYREPIEGFIATYYIYFIEIIYALWIVIFAFKKYRGSKHEDKKQIILAVSGIVLFLISFTSGNIIGSFTENWTLAQIGLFSMPVFVIFLTYMIVKFRSFNIKMFGAQALVFALGFLVLAILFIRKIENVRMVVFFTLFFVIITGYLLIRSVKKEVKQREQLEILSEQLLVANDKLKELDKLKTEFLSLASHQLRSPLTAIKGYSSMLAEGDFGEINEKAKEAATRIFDSSSSLAITVEDFLSVSKIESGGMKYEMIDFDFAEVAESMTKDLSITAEKKGLKLIYSNDNSGPYNVHGDKEKLRQIALNFIDNSIKYTKIGNIQVNLSHKDDKVIFSVKDTGMGITPEIKATLFQKFARGEGGKVNSSGSGLGLYLAKEISKAHKGDVGVESDGPNKGSTFWMELESINKI